MPIKVNWQRKDSPSRPANTAVLSSQYLNMT